MKNISFVLMFIPLISFAQTYKYIEIEDGLSNRRIFDIQKDSKGYMWLGINGNIIKIVLYIFELQQYTKQ